MTKVYSEDLAVAKAIISKDEGTTREYFYKKYYPMFFGYTTTITPTAQIAGSLSTKYIYWC